jgi:hypothetical protein
VLNLSGPLGVLTIMPFISIYAGITGFIGWDPVTALLGQLEARHAAKPAPVIQSGLAAH